MNELEDTGRAGPAADTASRFLSSLPQTLSSPAMPVTPADVHRYAAGGEPLCAAPWGLSPQSIRFFESLAKQQGVTLVIPPWREAYTRLTGRNTAAECLRRLQTVLPETASIVPPSFCTTPDEIRQFISVYPPPCILKMPYSCSGRGLYWIENSGLTDASLQWIAGALKKQGQVSIEPALDKVCDFAMEFESNGNGRVTYQGLSVFDTLSGGTFSSCLLGRPETLSGRLSPYIPETLLQSVQDAVTALLTETLGGIYRGCLGVDMLVYRRDGAFAIHPMIELNLRHTMGWVALQLSRRWIHPSAQGRLVIASESSPGAAYATHLQMEKTHPLQCEDRKIRSGYFSLCPVAPETRYRACLFIH
jgi:hypothetical protein